MLKRPPAALAVRDAGASGRLTPASNRDGDELRDQRASPLAVPGQTDLRRTDVVHRDVGDSTITAPPGTGAMSLARVAAEARSRRSRGHNS
jgi:hypothetical protein